MNIAYSKNNVEGQLFVNKMLHSLLNQVNDPALILDRQQNVVLLVNSALLQLTAFTQDELCNKSVQELIPEIDLQEILPGSELTSTLKRRKRGPISAAIRISQLDISLPWYLLKISASDELSHGYRIDQPAIYNPLLDLSTLTSYSDLKISIKKALASARAMLETDLICLYHAKGEAPELYKIATLERNDLFPRTIPSNDLVQLKDLVLWTPGKKVQSEIHRAGRRADLAFVASVPLGQPEGLFGLLVAADNKDTQIGVRCKLVELIGNHIGNVFQHFILVENLKNRIISQEQRLNIRNALFENAAEGVLFLNPELQVLEANPVAEIMLGYSINEIRKQPVENVLVGAEGLMTALDSACRGIATHELGNVSLHRRNGQSFPAHIQTIPAMNEDVVTGIIVSIADESENEQIRLRTQQLEQRAVIGGFTAIFAHEVRNPINNISTGLQLLNSRLESGDPNQTVITRMQSDCIRLNNLMESVLSFVRPMEPKLQPMDLAELLGVIMDRWRPRLERLEIKPVFHPSKDVPEIIGDPRLLEQVFTNLISNAVEVMSKTGGTLAVRIAKNNTQKNYPQVEVTVSDSGPGIPDELKERIFEPFVSNNPRGTGLGLAITKHMVTVHRGTINVNSFPGGSVFHVFLPIHHGEK
jgi:two-component system sensor histidine kinase AtoS